LLIQIHDDTLDEMVKLIMNRLLTSYVMSFISLDGCSYGKLPFRNNSLCQGVIGQSAVVSFIM